MAYNASQDAVTKTGEFSDGGGWLDNADAFRHSYWNALMEKRISKNVYLNIGTPDFPYYTVIQVDFAKLFADAHEYGKTGIDTEMDLANNAIGRSDGANFSYLDESQLANQIMERVSCGHYWKIINPVIENNYVSSGNLVPSDWEGLKSEYIDDVLFETTLIGSTEIRIDKANWTIVGSYTIPSTIKGRTVTQIGDVAFVNQIQMSQVSFPTSVTIIGANAFENCIRLADIILPNNLISIGDSAFKGCVSLESIIIPNSVTTIGYNAFQNCTKLDTVTVLRENSFITNLGPYAFHGCNLLREIIVPINRVAEYKNKVNWSSYSQRIIPSSSNFDEYDLNCLKYFDVTLSLNPGYNKIYKLEIECAKSYKITSNALSAIKMSLYDSNMKLVNNSPTMSDNNRKGIFNLYLTPGTYYIDLRFEDNSSSGNIKTSHELTWANNGWDISFNTDNNVLSHLHEIEPGLYKNKLQYFNNQGAGFYELKLSGTKTDATDVYYPEGAITIYNDSSRTTLLNKFTLAGYPNQAKTSNETNSMVVYLPRNGYFYIDVNMTSNNLSSLKLYINPIGSQELSLYNLPESTNESIDIFNETSKGDYFQKLNINQTGKFTVYASYTGFQTNTLFVLAKLNYNSTLNTYTLETKIVDILSAKEYPDSKTLTLDEGTYYIGYFNKNDDISLDVSIDRLVTQSGSHVLVTDPDSATPSGSQINIIEMNNPLKSYRQSFITKGFTRIIYPDYNYEVPASRLDYHWYSSNENIATVTDFGTVLGKNVGTVKIMAVLKEDPSKVFVKEFTIIEDTGTEPFVVNSTLTVKYSETDNGTFKLNLEKVNCPYPWFQDYNWNLYIPCQGNNISVIYDVWGFITVSDTGEFILTGNYLKNSRVTVIINVIIEP